MIGRLRPLTCKEVKTILKKAGFKPLPRKGTSHEQWVHDNYNGQFRKVTVDCPKAPFSKDLITFMMSQAGMKRREFYGWLGK